MAFRASFTGSVPPSKKRVPTFGHNQKGPNYAFPVEGVNPASEDKGAGGRVTGPREN